MIAYFPSVLRCVGEKLLPEIIGYGCDYPLNAAGQDASHDYERGDPETGESHRPKRGGNLSESVEAALEQDRRIAARVAIAMIATASFQGGKFCHDMLKAELI
jgi:hypothetical protein